MAVYYFTICTLTGLGFVLTEKQKHAKTTVLYLSVVFALLTFLASFRYAIGFDYFAYRNIFEMTSNLSFNDILYYYGYEPLFFVLCALFHLCGLSFQSLITSVSIFVILAAMWFIFRYSKLPWMSVYLYITLQFFAYDMNLMRQAIGVSFFLLAYPYLEHQKPLPYTILLFVGGLFHNSLWFMFPLYFLLPKKFSCKSAACLALITGCGYLFFDPLFLLIKPFLPEKYAIYQDSYFWNSNSWEYLVLPALYCLLIFLFRKRIKNLRRRTIYLNSAIFYFLIHLFITKHFILERFAIYPFVFSLTAIPEIVASYRSAGRSSAKHPRMLQKYDCMILLFLAFGGAFFLFAAQKGFHHVYPYVSLLDQSRSMPVGN